MPYRRCRDSFMSQYYFSAKLIAKKRPVKIRQEKMKNSQSSIKQSEGLKLGGIQSWRDNIQYE